MASPSNQPPGGTKAERGEEITSGKFDILGIRIGMPIRDAESILKKYKPQFKFTFVKTGAGALPAGSPPDYAAFTADTMAKGQGDSTAERALLHGETVYVRGTFDAPHLVTQVSRKVSMTQADSPPRDLVRAQTIEKYGSTEIPNTGLSLDWGFDTQGRPCAGPTLSSACVAGTLHAEYMSWELFSRALNKLSGEQERRFSSAKRETENQKHREQTKNNLPAL